jgi:CRP/FNR family transcriptional regulator, cyclic AMP receptor protein
VEQADEILAELARLGETRTWEPGLVVVSEGDPADCLYIVHTGELRAVVAGEGERKVELAVVDGNRLVVPGPLSQARIAERLGASRAMVNRLLQDLTRGGYIEVSRQRIVLLSELPRRW